MSYHLAFGGKLYGGQIRKLGAQVLKPLQEEEKKILLHVMVRESENNVEHMSSGGG